MSTFQVAAYLASIILTGITVGWAFRIAKLSGQKYFWSFLLFIIANNLVCILDIVFRYFPGHISKTTFSQSRAFLDMISGFIMFPLMAAFTFLFVAFITGLARTNVPVFTKRMYGIYWVIVFLGFMAAEVRYFESGDRLLIDIFNPAFNLGIITGILYGSLYSLFHSKKLDNLISRSLVRNISLYYIASICLFFIMNTREAPLHLNIDVILRSLLGLAYNLPPLFLISYYLRKHDRAPVFVVDGDAVLDQWLESQKISPRESEIIRLLIQGKSNRRIEKELFISLRTVESHIYSIYRKLGVKNRVQLLRLVLDKCRAVERSE